MSSKDRNVSTVLDLLTMLHRGKKEQNFSLSIEMPGILIVTKEHVTLTGLTIPTYINTLNSIGRKGYFFAISIYEKKYHKLFKELQKPTSFNEIMKKLEGSNKNVISLEHKKKYYEPLVKALVPMKYTRDVQEVIREEVTFSSLLKESNGVIGSHNDQNVSYIILSPYRSIERLLSKLNDGESLKNIQDQEIWFDPINNTLYYFGGSIYLGKIKRAKEALLALFSQDEPCAINFDDIPESSRDSFNKKEQKAYYDSLFRVLSKDRKLKDIFILHQDNLEIRPEYREQAH